MGWRVAGAFLRGLLLGGLLLAAPARAQDRSEDADPAAVADGSSGPSAAVGAKVAAIVDELRRSKGARDMHRAADVLSALGRPAVPALLGHLTEPDNTFLSKFVLARALAANLQESDIPHVARALADGHAEAAEALALLHCDAARDALLGALRSGHADREILDALVPYASDEATHAAALEWLEAHSAESLATDDVARLLARGGCELAVEALTRLLGETQGLTKRMHGPDLAVSLARLGGRAGLDALVEMATQPGRDLWAAAYGLGEVIPTPATAIPGRREHWRFGMVGPDAQIPRRVEVSRGAKTRERIAAWWAEVHDRVEYDPTLRLWVDPVGSPWQLAPAGDARVGEQVRLLLRQATTWDLRRDQEERSGNDEPVHLLDLGREAVPELIRTLRANDCEWDERAAAVEALRELHTDADLPLIEELIRRGRTAAIGVLRDCAHPGVRDALLARVATGSAHEGIVAVLATRPADAATWAAVSSWHRMRRETWDNANTEALGQYLEVSATTAALPVLREILDETRGASLLRVHAASALANVGELDGIEALLDIVALWCDPSASLRLPDDDPRSIAAIRLNRIVGVRMFTGQPGPVGAHHRAIAARCRAWWGRYGDDLWFDADRRVWRTDRRREEGARAPESDPEIVAAVERVLGRLVTASHFSWGRLDPLLARNEPRDRLVALGRGALPELIRVVRRGSPWRTDGHGWTVRPVIAAGEALSELATEADAPVMRELLADGRLEVLPWFKRHPDHANLPVFIDVVERGFGHYRVLRALREQPVTWRVHRTLLYRIASLDSVGEFETVRLAEVLGRTAALTGKPVPTDLLERRLSDRVRWRIAAHLASRGWRPGLDALVETFRSAHADTHPVETMAAALNTLVTVDDATDVGAGDVGTGDVGGGGVEDGAERALLLPRGRLLAHPARISGGDLNLFDWPDRWVGTRAERSADHEAAVVRLDAWWAENSGRLTFDEDVRAWRVDR